MGSVHPSVCPSVHPSVCPSVHPFVCPFICLSQLGDDMEKEKEVVRENGSLRTVWKQCCLPKSLGASDSEILGVRDCHGEFLGDECRPQACMYTDCIHTVYVHRLYSCTVCTHTLSIHCM